jgi:primosomal protein N' (replication factor Y)
MAAKAIAEVVFNIPLERSFHYLIPPKLQGLLQPGMRVMAPFGSREQMGFVTQLLAKSPIHELKAIRRLIDPLPVIADERWKLALWLSEYYYCSLGEALAVIIPSQLRMSAQDAAEHQPAGMPSSVQEVAQSTERALSPSQLRALETIAASLDAKEAQTILLHGVTGSGKTELYLQAIKGALKRGRSAICLVPEIALSPQTIDRFRERFKDDVALWHSRLTATQRAKAWEQLSSGRCRIVVGVRSAVFAPVKALGLIILDEEHEPTYKQENTPHYHARDVALARARLVGATVMLGSATPSVESYYHATQGDYHLITLPERVEGRSLPSVEVVDLREELGRRHRAGPLSDRLARELAGTVERGEQAILLLNRRGFARTAQCPLCGFVVRCERCSVPLVYHAGEQTLVCHYCNARRALAELCSQCHKGYLRLRGAGTERIESELHRLFPAAAIARMDRDTTKHRESHRQLYDALKARQIGLLVGTQMVAKGLDFPEVTLVGVVSADTSLNLPDFRAGERTFDLLTQVAGRAGRGERPGRVVIQTYCPHHYAIQAAMRHDYERFYREEINMRRQLKLPPFVHLIELTVRGSSQRRVDEAAGRLAERLKRSANPRRIKVLGPAPHRIPRLRRSYRMCVLLKGGTVTAMVALLRLAFAPGRRFQGMPVTVDVDPS